MTVDNNAGSPFRDRDLRDLDRVRRRRHRLHLRGPLQTTTARRSATASLVSKDSPFCTNTFGAATPNGRCNENQFSDPFVGPDGNLYVAYDNFNNQPHERHRQPLPGAAGEVDRRRGQTSPLRSRSATTTTCPTATPTRAPAPIRAAPACRRRARRRSRCSGPPTTPRARSIRRIRTASSVDVRLLHQPGLQRGQRLHAGRLRRGRQPDLHRGQDRRRLQQQDPAQRLQRRRRDVHRRRAPIPRSRRVVTAFARPGHDRPVLAVDRVHEPGQARRRLLRPPVRQRRDQRLLGLQPVREPGSGQFRPGPGDDELDAAPRPSSRVPPAASSTAITSGSRPRATRPIRSGRTPARTDLFLCPGTGKPGMPPSLCGATETNGEVANDEDVFTASVTVPTASSHH